MATAQLFLLYFTTLLLTDQVNSLSCYVCATGDLDEFGECQSQFQYDCSGYASRFPEDRVYCRTTRERARNGTYSITKECITETDHYQKFPDKGYPLDEECDLVDIQNEEVAYCVCRKSMCNQNPIAEQFIAFEEKHPELFGDSDAVPAREPSSVSQGGAPLVLPGVNSGPAQFAAPQLTPPAIVPVNDPRFSPTRPPTTSEEVPDVRRQQLPTRSEERPVLPSRIDGMFLMPRAPSVSQSGFVGTVGQEPAVVAVPVTTKAPPASSLRCMQCGERGLTSESSDCSGAVPVNCNPQDNLCFTRVISVISGQFAVEKMCASKEVVRAMFGDDVSDNFCGTGSKGSEKFCTCNTNDCNHLSYSQQKSSFQPPAAPEVPSVPAFVAPHIHSQGPFPHLAAPELPVHPPEIASIPNVQVKQRDSKTNTIEADRITEEMLKKLEQAPEIPVSTEKPKPIVPVVVNKAGVNSARCVSCSQADLADPTADCTQTSMMDCPNMETNAMCLTKQTQVGSGFMIEKRCVSKEEFSMVGPSGQLFEEGCATTEDGMINFCLCKGDICNKASLLAQAQNNGIQEVMQTVAVQTEAPQPPKQIEPNNFLTQEKIPKENPEPKLFDFNHQETGLTSEEKELIQHKIQWSGTRDSSSSLPCSFISILLLLVGVRYVF